VRWRALGSGVDGPVRAILEFQGDLYVGGEFGWSGSTPVANVARWDGSAWRRLQGVRLRYPADAIVGEYGTGCVRTPALVAGRPYAGSQFFELTAALLPHDTPCVLLLGIAPGAIPIGGGCFLNLAAVAASVSLSTDFLGRVTLPLPLPDSPLVQGDIFAQWAWAETAGIGMSRGLRIQVR